jgi:hypothetical protein
MIRWAVSQPNLPKKSAVNVGMPGARPSQELFCDGTCSPAANSLSNQCLERIWAKLFDLSQNLNASGPA